MLGRLESIVTLFTRITTGILFVAAVYIHIFWGSDTSLEVGLLWQILIVGAICSVGSFLLPFEKMEKGGMSKGIVLRTILYYLYINITVLGCAFYFGWCDLDDWKMVLGMVAAIAFVFVVVSAVSYWIEYQTAEKMNAKLRERENEE